MCTTGRGASGASKRVGAVGSLGAERTVEGGLGLGWDCLCVHIDAAV